MKKYMTPTVDYSVIALKDIITVSIDENGMPSNVDILNEKK